MGRTHSAVWALEPAPLQPCALGHPEIAAECGTHPEYGPSPLGLGTGSSQLPSDLPTSLPSPVERVGGPATSHSGRLCSSSPGALESAPLVQAGPRQAPSAAPGHPRARPRSEPALQLHSHPASRAAPGQRAPYGMTGPSGVRLRRAGRRGLTGPRAWGLICGAPLARDRTCEQLTQQPLLLVPLVIGSHHALPWERVCSQPLPSQSTPRSLALVRSRRGQHLLDEVF